MNSYSARIPDSLIALENRTTRLLESGRKVSDSKLVSAPTDFRCVSWWLRWIRFASVGLLASTLLDPSASAQAVFAPGESLGTSDGNVGIGTNAPAFKLHVADAGDVRVALVPLNGANNRESLLDLWATFDNFQPDTIVRRAARIQAGFDGGTWNTEYLAFGVAGGGDGNSPPIERMRISANGNLGIGTSNPGSRLHVEGGRVFVSSTSFPNHGSYSGADLVIGSNADERGGYGTPSGSHIMLRSSGKSAITALDESQSLGQISYENLRWTIGENVGWGDQVVYMPGSVGIGTSNPSHKLAVNGTIRAKEIIVEVAWADCVFADGFRLPPLSELEAYVTTNRHLPGIPTASEISTGGVPVGEIESKLLAKVEELTLYLIDQQKEIAGLRAEVASLRRGEER